MDADFWLERWERHEIGFHQQETNAALQAHWEALGVPRDGTVLVPLCGKSRDMLWLRSRGHPILGVELSRIAVRDFFAESGLAPEVSTQRGFERWEAEGIALLCGDFFALTPSDLAGVAGVYDRASLIALPREMRERYARAMGSMLPAGAKTLLITLSYPDGELTAPPFSVPEAEVRRLYEDAFEVERMAASDALAANPGLRERGITRLTEETFRLRRLPASLK